MAESYKLMAPPPLGAGGVQRLEDGAFIPEDAGNADWQQYREWVAAGNTAHAADYAPPTAKQPLPGPK